MMQTEAAKLIGVSRRQRRARATGGRTGRASGLIPLFGPFDSSCPS
jgi:hypothetical protein